MVPSNIRGRIAFVFAESNFDIDLIVGLKHVKTSDLDQLKKVVMRDYDKNFVKDVRPGDLLVGGVNFGYGHPHYPSMRIMRYLGIRAVIAESFFPLYRTSEMSIGFPQVECAGVLDFVERWDDVEIAWDTGQIVNHTRRRSLPFQLPSRKDLAVLVAGGVVPYLKRELSAELPKNFEQRPDPILRPESAREQI